jgi:hypothetical protein
MKTKRKYLRRFQHRTKRYKKLQKGGISTLLKALAGLAYLAAPSTANYNPKPMPNYGTAVSTYTPGPTYTTAMAPSYGTSVSTYSPTYTPSGQSFLNAVSTPNRLGLNVQPTISATPSTNAGAVMVSPREIAASITPESFTTPSPVPGPIAEFVEPIHAVLQTANAEFLQGLAPVSEQLISATVAPQNLREGIVLSGHNTLTNNPTTIPLVGTPLASVNQQLSLDQYLEHCATTGKCFLDIDMYKSGDTIISAHGGKILGGIINRSEGADNTRPILEKVHAFAKEHPHVTFTIRSENHGVYSEELTSMLTPEMKSQVAVFSKHNIPTNGALQSEGRNIMYFLESTNEAKVDQSTGIYEGSLVMAQNHYFVRSSWDRIQDFSTATPETIGDLMIADMARLPKKPMCLFDGYKTGVGAEVKGHMEQSTFVANFKTDMLPKVKAYLASKGFDVEDMGCVVMMDNVDSNAFAYQVGLQYADNIENPEARAAVLEAMPTLFVQSQEALSEHLADGFQRPIANSFQRLGKAIQGKSVNLDTADVVIPTLSVTAVAGFLYVVAALSKKLFKQGKKIAASALDVFLNRVEQENPEAAQIIELGKTASETLPTSPIREDPKALGVSPGQTPGGSPGSNNPRPGSESPKKKKSKGKQNLSNDYIISSAFGQSAARTRKLPARIRR